MYNIIKSVNVLCINFTFLVFFLTHRAIEDHTIPYFIVYMILILRYKKFLVIFCFICRPRPRLALPYKVKMQYLHFRSYVEYFLLSWKIPKVMSRRSILFHL